MVLLLVVTSLLALTGPATPMSAARSRGVLRRPVRASRIAMVESLTCDVRKLPKSAVALDIKVPAAVSNEVHLKTLANLAKQSKMDGFRDGKVPPQAVIAKIGMKRVKEATVEQIVDVGMSQSGVQGKLNTLGEARLSEKLEELASRYKIGEAIAFTVEVDVYPEVPVDPAAYSALAVEVEKIEFNQPAYDAALLKLRTQHADLVEVEGESQEGWQLQVNMNGFLAGADGERGEPLPNVAGGDGVQLPLTPGKFMPGLVEGLMGVKAGEKREIRVTFPPRSSAPSLAGKEAVFEVECLKVQRAQLPEVETPVGRDGFAAKVMPELDWAGLDAKLREGVQQDSDARLRAGTHKALMKALQESLPSSFEVPESLVADVTKERFAGMLAGMREQGTTDEQLKELITPENYEKYCTISRPMTLATIKADFALQARAAPHRHTKEQPRTLAALPA